MNLDQIRQLIQFMNENGLSELEIEEEGTKVRLRKATAETAPILVAAPTASASVPVSPPPTTVTVEPTQKKFFSITSPIVGTFYRAPSPDANPFVEVGDVVEPETVVCIIEAMKVMNEIKAEVEGKVVEVLVGNNQAVEFGQPLFLVEPAA